MPLAYPHHTHPSVAPTSVGADEPRSFYRGLTPTTTDIALLRS